MFYSQLDTFTKNIALIDCASGEKISYTELNDRCINLAQSLGNKKELVFIETKNNIASVVSYLACLKANKVVYLLDDLNSDNTKNLLDTYRPQITINKEAEIIRNNNKVYDIEDNITLLLATSGSTGSPKFVKLSSKNIVSNATSIAQYLKLSSEDVALSHLKLHYSYGLSILNSHLEVGATIAFSSYSVLDDGFWKDINTYNATSFAGVPYTFETLLRRKFDFKEYPSLRYITQAGGKLEANLIKKISSQAQKYQIDFFVMYGQTEASPRISYLPPELVAKYPGSIGRVIPGGKLTLLDINKKEITELDVPGELAYSGDNVMMGYAESLADLTTDDTPEMLLTGDIACRTGNDLFYIVGRTKRFVKLFGLRINLDDVQSYVKITHPQSAVTGDDNKIIIALEKQDSIDEDAFINAISKKYSLPKNIFKLNFFSEIPLMSSGKYDFKEIMLHAELMPKPVLFKRFYNRMIDVLELRETSWPNIETLFQEILSLELMEHHKSFNDLEADSLSFVQLSIELETCLCDEFPDNWQEYSIKSLDELYLKVRLG